MKCKVVSASLGYNERIYRKGDDIDIESPSEVKRLSGYGHIQALPSEAPVDKEVSIVANPPKVLPEAKAHSGTKTPRGGKKEK